MSVWPPLKIGPGRIKGGMAAKSGAEMAPQPPSVASVAIAAIARAARLAGLLRPT
jgi:hypothetical protein